MKKFVVKNKKTNTTFHVEEVGDQTKARRLTRPVENPAAVGDADKPELTKEEIESLKELAELLPELKKLLKPKDDDEAGDSDEDGAGESEAEGETNDEGETKPGQGEGDVVFEEEQDELIDEEEEEGDEASAEDGCGAHADDSRASFGSIVARDVGDSVLAQEEEVAQAFNSRYTKSLIK